MFRKRFKSMYMSKDLIKKHEQAEKEIVEEAIKTSEDEYIIRITLGSEQEIFHKFTLISKQMLNDEILSYLEHQARYIPLAYPIKIHVTLPNNSDEVIKRLRYLVNRAIIRKVNETIHDLKRNLRRNISVSILGLLMMGLSFFFSKISNFLIVSDIIMVTWWVFLWRAIEGYFFERRKLSLKKQKLLQIYLAEYISE